MGPGQEVQSPRQLLPPLLLLPFGNNSLYVAQDGLGFALSPTMA
jgi:hypothetical protein